VGDLIPQKNGGLGTCAPRFPTYAPTFVVSETRRLVEEMQNTLIFKKHSNNLKFNSCYHSIENVYYTYLKLALINKSDTGSL